VKSLSKGAVALISSLALIVAAGVASAADEHKIWICHGTASEPNPYVLISVDESARAGHFDGTAPGHGPNNNPDQEVGPDGTCPTTPPDDGGDDGGDGGGGED
jgi:hypothetical protein